jgi:hypothetical protein
MRARIETLLPDRGPLKDDHVPLWDAQKGYEEARGTLFLNIDLILHRKISLRWELKCDTVVNCRGLITLTLLSATWG